MDKERGLHLSRRTLLGLAASELFATEAVLQTGIPAATKDKPQSKIWLAHGFWWAILPSTDGPCLWKRGVGGWERQSHLDAFFRALPRQADVLTSGNIAAAVLVESTRLAVVRLTWDRAHGRYLPAGNPALFPDQQGIETATIASAASRLWIAYNSGRHMWVRVAAVDQVWSEPILISNSPAKDDDLCQIVAFAGGVGVIWSDQAADTVWLRRNSGKTWLPPEIAASGGHTADDHISTAVARDGTLYVATKNSVDLPGQPQLVLRVRSPRSGWRNLPYAPLTATQAPTRPIALLSADQRTLHLLHTVAYPGVRPPNNSIVHHSTRATVLNLDAAPQVIIGGPGLINNVTGPKQGLATNGGFVLASDMDGNVYEAHIR